MTLKLRDELIRLEKNSYASDEINIPINGVDCSEGCNPYGYPKEIARVYKEFDIEKLSLYPHSMAATNSIIGYWKEECNLEKENIMLTDGSIAALYLINNLFNIKGPKILGFAPQFSDFGANVKLLGMNYNPYFAKIEDNLKMSIDNLIYELNDEYSLVYIDNPNNPTGQIFKTEDIKKLLDKAKKLDICVVIDEAYGDFMKKENSSVKFLEEYENLIVVRTMSKGFGLAGLRAGYILADKKIITCMNKVSNPYQVGELTRELIAEALNVGNHLDEAMEEFKYAKKRIKENIGENLQMAETSLSVPICTLYHKDSTVNLQKEFTKYGILTVAGSEFDGLNSAFVRMRMPKRNELDKLIFAIDKINKG